MLFVTGCWRPLLQMAGQLLDVALQPCFRDRFSRWLDFAFNRRVQLVKSLGSSTAEGVVARHRFRRYLKRVDENRLCSCFEILSVAVIGQCIGDVVRLLLHNHHVSERCNSTGGMLGKVNQSRSYASCLIIAAS